MRAEPALAGDGLDVALLAGRPGINPGCGESRYRAILSKRGNIFTVLQNKDFSLCFGFWVFLGIMFFREPHLFQSIGSL